MGYNRCEVYLVWRVCREKLIGEEMVVCLYI